MTDHKPRILLDFGRERNRTRGDCRGFSGLANAVAERLGTVVEIVDDFLLEEEYGIDSLGEKYKYYEDYLIGSRREFLEKAGYPDIVFSPGSDFRKVYTGEEKITLAYYGWNEDYAGSIPVSHNGQQFKNIAMMLNSLTPEKLAEEGHKFEARYPGLPRPLIAVNFIQHSRPQEFALQLAATAYNYPHATLFINTCWRTEGKDYLALMDELKKILPKKIQLRSFMMAQCFNEAAGSEFNPYMGLLDRADHIILCGDSKSMMTEPLAAGKTPYKVRFHSGWQQVPQEDEDLEEYGLLHVFNDAATDHPLVTERIKPINATFTFADHVVAQYRAEKAKAKLLALQTTFVARKGLNLTSAA